MERLSMYQFKLLVTSVLLGTMLLDSPTEILLTAGRDGWMCTLPGYLLVIPYGLLVISLMNRYPGMDLLQVSAQVFGKWTGKGIGLIFCLVFIYLSGLNAAEAGVIFANSIMPLTPVWVFHAATAFLIFLLAMAGIEILGRFVETVFPIAVLMYAVILIFAVSQFERGELFPLLENGIGPVLNGTVKIFPHALEFIAFFAMLLPVLPSPNDKKARRTLRRSIAIGACFVGIMTSMVIMALIETFGEDASRLTFGVVVLAKAVEFKNMLAGGESILEMIGYSLFLIKSAALFFAAFWALKMVFGFKSDRWKIVLIVLLLAAELLSGGAVDLLLEVKYLQLYIIIPFIGAWIPALWIMERWRRRKKA